MNARMGELGFAIQAGKGLPAANPRWAVPLWFSGSLPYPDPERSVHQAQNNRLPTQEVRRLSVPWLTDSPLPGFPAILPVLLQGLLSDVQVDAGQQIFQPGLQDVWYTFFSRRPGLLYERYADGLVEGLRFDFASGELLTVNVQAQGLAPTVLAAPYSATDTHDIRGGILSYVGADVYFDWADDTPTVERWEAESGNLYISRPAQVHHNYRSVIPEYMVRGPLSVELAVELVFRDNEHYLHTVYGGLAETVPQPETVYGSAEMTFYDYTDVTRWMTVSLPALEWEVAPPEPLPEPGSGHVVVQAVGRGVVPASVGRTGHVVSIRVDVGGERYGAVVPPTVVGTATSSIPTPTVTASGGIVAGPVGRTATVSTPTLTALGATPSPTTAHGWVPTPVVTV